MKDKKWQPKDLPIRVVSKLCIFFFSFRVIFSSRVVSFFPRLIYRIIMYFLFLVELKMNFLYDFCYCNSRFIIFSSSWKPKLCLGNRECIFFVFLIFFSSLRVVHFFTNFFFPLSLSLCDFPLKIFLSQFYFCYSLPRMRLAISSTSLSLSFFCHFISWVSCLSCTFPFHPPVRSRLLHILKCDPVFPLTYIFHLA